MKPPAAARCTPYAVVFLFVLTFATSGTAYLLSSSAVHRAQMSAASTVQLCQAGNESRAQQVILWEHLVAISKPPLHETAGQRRQREKLTAAFLRFVHQVFAPRNCQRLKGQ